MLEQIETVQFIKGGLILGWLLLFFIWERVCSFTGNTDFSFTDVDCVRLMKNISLWLINVLLSPLVVIPISLWVSSYSLPWRPEWWGGSIGLVLDLLLLDLWIYWWHRANHEFAFLWRFHQVHHLDQNMDVTTALRFHFGEVVLSALVRVIIVFCLGIPLISIVIFETLLMVSAVFHHSDVRLNPSVEKTLSRFIITPSIHWVHHHAIRQDTDSNYGAILSCWDRLFGSSNGVSRNPRWKLGIEKQPDKSLLALLIVPFEGGSND
jgi:sterol desaturase/sphingolipid hydroxylase (fatty acid hydroxylase superfamily)